MVVKKVLIANRSEVALRIQATCHARGIQTVAVYSPEDARSRFVSSATQAYALKEKGARAYFDQDTIIEIALKSGADAVHPGYGFLAENHTFAQKVIDAGLLWIGPSPVSMALMGDKISARNAMDACGVPTVPGAMLDIRIDTVEHAQEKARTLGYPVMIKDPKSGGGKAMRRVLTDEAFHDAWYAVLAEASRLTGSTTILIEKYIAQARHIEVQVAGDGTSFIHLFERDCSVQRRHQKIIEEAPCISVSQQTLDRMYATAVIAARAAQYDSIGTVEFIVTQDEQFYFLEMNTRLQVEHGVTELTTGVDLVGLQLDIATQSVQLPFQSSITRTGHAIQTRLYAENPETNFTPSTGTLQVVSFPHAPWTRIEHDLAAGHEVTPFFDPMIAKIMAWGSDREQCIARLQATLASITVTGIVTNKALLHTLLGTPEFRAGNFYTNLLGDKNLLDEILSGSQIPVWDDKGLAREDFLSSRARTRDPLPSIPSPTFLAGVAVMLAQQAQARKIMPATYIKQNSASARRWREQR